MLSFFKKSFIVLFIFIQCLNADQGYIPVQKLTGFTDWVTTIALSSSERILLTGDMSKTVHVLELSNNTASLYGKITAFNQEPSHFTFWDSNSLFSVATLDRQSYLFKLLPDKTISNISQSSIPRNLVPAVGISMDERILVEPNNENAKIYIFDSQKKDYTFLQVLRRHAARIVCITVSSDNNIIITGSQDKSAMIWQFNGTFFILKQVLRGHNSGVRSIAISQDNQMIITGSDDSTLRVWQLSPTGLLYQCTQVLNGHSEAVYSIDISRSKQMIVSGSGDKTVVIWKLQN